MLYYYRMNDTTLSYRSRTSRDSACPVLFRASSYLIGTLFCLLSALVDSLFGGVFNFASGVFGSSSSGLAGLFGGITYVFAGVFHVVAGVLHILGGALRENAGCAAECQGNTNFSE